MAHIMKYFIPAVIGISIGLVLFFSSGWWGFLFIFPWIGICITTGCLISRKKKGKQKDLGRRICILAIAPVFLFFVGIYQGENLQIEETVICFLFFLNTGYFTGVLVHYTIAKIGGPLIWGRGFCGWACWTAAPLEWLPIKENNKIPPSLGNIRYFVLILSILIPLVFVWLGYDWYANNINISTNVGKTGALTWFLTSNVLYYILAVILAFKYKKKRAFCKIVCPVSLVMKAQSTVTRIHRKPNENSCSGCGSCYKHCPMDMDVMSYISENRKVSSGECILCGICTNICPEKAID